MWGGPSKYDKLGQELERIRDPIAYDIKAAIAPWSVHPDVAHPKKDEPTMSHDLCECPPLKPIPSEPQLFDKLKPGWTWQYFAMLSVLSFVLGATVATGVMAILGRERSPATGIEPVTIKKLDGGAVEWRCGEAFHRLQPGESWDVIYGGSRHRITVTPQGHMTAEFSDPPLPTDSRDK